MTLNPYRHNHNQVEEIPWSRLGRLLIELTEMIQESFHPEIVLGIAKGGVVPGLFLSSAYLVDFFPIKISSRHNEQVIFEKPVWYIYPTDAVRGKKVLLADDICVAGRTLEIAKIEIMKRGAAEVRTATLAIHEDSIHPDYFVLNTDALIVWPWDRDILSEDGTWFINKEYMSEMEKIPGYKPGFSPAREPIGHWEK